MAPSSRTVAPAGVLAASAVALLLLALPARAEDARSGAARTATLSQAAAAAPDDAQAREAAGAAFEGGVLRDDQVSDDGTRTIKKGIPLRPPAPLTTQTPKIPAPGADKEPKEDHGKLSTSLMMGGAALLGGLQGWFSAGLLGAAAGTGLGLAAAWLFHKKDYGGAFGVTAGAIIGTAFGGPIGGLIGAAVGGVLGHFIGKLFF